MRNLESINYHVTPRYKEYWYYEDYIYDAKGYVPFDISQIEIAVLTATIASLFPITQSCFIAPASSKRVEHCGTRNLTIIDPELVAIKYF